MVWESSLAGAEKITFLAPAWSKVGQFMSIKFVPTPLWISRKEQIVAFDINQLPLAAVHCIYTYTVKVQCEPYYTLPLIHLHIYMYIL